MRRPSLRVTVTLAVVIVGVVELQNLVQTIRAQARLRDRMVRTIREAVVSARPRLALVLRSGDAASWHEAAEEALRSSLGSEVEVFDPGGKRLLAYPASSPVEHWIDAGDFRALQGGEILTFGPLMGEAGRVLTYGLFSSADHKVVLRLSMAIPDLVEDLRERQQLLVTHAVALVVLVLAGALVFFPGADREGSAPGAMHAYEQAMERLRDRGQEASLQHQAERRRMTAQIEDKEALARAGELTAGIVHEVRNGLGTILGYARLIERSAASEAVEPARHIREECETLEAVIRRFMDFVRRETVDRTTFDLSRMLARVVARESQRRPDVDVKLDLPEEDAIAGDEELLERAFENLVRNACEAANSTIRVGLETEGDTRVVKITDDGPGIPPGGKEKLRPFFTTKAGGLGLGLPIALKIVGLHDGVVELHDVSPCGLEVRVRLLKEHQAEAGVTGSSVEARLV